MEKQSLGNKIAALRREKGMTQLELAEKMSVTDKAVSKWERDLSIPDTASLPRLAELLGISVDELMGAKAAPPDRAKFREFLHLIFRGIALAMGVAAAVLSLLRQVEINSAVGMLGIGLACLALSLFPKER